MKWNQAQPSRTIIFIQLQPLRQQNIDQIIFLLANGRVRDLTTFAANVAYLRATDKAGEKADLCKQSPHIVANHTVHSITDQ